MQESEGGVLMALVTTPFRPSLAVYIGCHIGANYAKSHHDKISEL